MTQELEIEYKNILTSQEFNHIKNFFNIQNSHFIEQENHYFDTKDFTLKNNQSALRIRVKADRHTLTLKQPQPVGLLETHEPLTTKQVSSLLSGESKIEGKIYSILQEMGINPELLQYFGSLKTSRAEIPYKNGVLVLDHSFYLNVEDYELEYEVEDAKEGFQHFQDLLAHLKIPTRHTENKIQRFYRQLKQK
ncbi:CYTH domain-containing protein [Litchfieldia salsa]|uniref:Uncharacterized protein YjbK n=1 Tax=Litchfieldia salsa TaxID=930152 RepID=A0A1H0S451_9BACI|nr:CYTH domain-containing protein [Litchfieldia salsa]SDP36543.1 Uncharacterized protein YjbK [Litchfieldia salsa]